MLDVKNVFEQRVAARLLEFFDRDVPWHRALWGPGLRLLLLEILEASEAVSAKVLTPGSLKHLMRSALSVAGKDPGLGGPKQRSLLHHSLDSDLVFRGEAYFSIEGVTREIEKKYLERWATAFDAGTQPSVERTARSIAAHLLDLGFGSDFLHRWWTYRLHYEVGQRSLTEIVADADRLCAQPEREHVALVLFEGLPTRAGVPPNWLDSEKASRWVIEHGFTVHGFRQNGGMLIRISARDPYAAVDIVRGRIEMLAARVALGLSARIKVVPKVWIEGEKHVFDLYRGRRGAEIHALRREGQIFADATTSPLLDAAVALLQSINTGTPSTAISGSWAAIETLLYSRVMRNASPRAIA